MRMISNTLKAQTTCNLLISKDQYYQPLILLNLLFRGI